MKRIITPGTIPTGDLHQYLLGSVAPRPIAFVSTIDDLGRPNLAPYSFFNAFSSNPPILVFSSNRRVDNNTTKDTLHNILINKECVVNVVSYSIVRQMMVSSVDFPNDISEFDQTGLTPVPSTMVKPPIVKESPVNMECKVQDIITLGDKGGAGHLIICHVVCIHIDESVLDENQRIDPHKIDLMGRMGRAFYVRASGDAVLFMPQSQQLPVVGYHNIPDHIKSSDILTANHLGMLAGLKNLPTKEEALKMLSVDPELASLIPLQKIDKHQIAVKYFNLNQIEKAAAILMSI